MADVTIYKIRRKSDGLYSTGGTSPRFTKKGKTWTGLGPLHGHLTQHSGANLKSGCQLPKTYRDCEVVRYVVVEHLNFAMDLDEYDLKRRENHRPR